MTGRERLLATVRHEEPDRVPICPRIQWTWLDPDQTHGLEETYSPAIDPMEILSSRTPNYLVSYPDTYNLPQVRVEQQRHEDGEYYHIYALDRMIAAGKVAYKSVEGQRLDTGEPAGYLEAVLEYAWREPAWREVIRRFVAGRK